MTRVAVASPLRMATEAGLDAGRRGGNAIDAALATAAVLTVAYPASCGIGGDLLALVREPDGRTTFIDASGRAPLATDVGAAQSRHREMPIHGPLPVTVPGLVGGWAALADHGAALPWRDLLAPAQAAASDGIPVSAGLAEFDRRDRASSSDPSRTWQRCSALGDPPSPRDRRCANRRSR